MRYALCIIISLLLMPLVLLAEGYTPRYYVSRAESYIQSRAWNEAKRVIDEGLAGYPANPDLRYLNGRYYYQARQYNEARYNLVKSIQADDQHFKAKRLLVDVEDDTKHYSSAICYINELLEFQPYDIDLWRRKIALYRKMNNHAEADAALERLSRIYPNDTLVTNDLKRRRRENLRTITNTSNLSESAATIEQWLDKDPKNLEYYLDLIGVYQRMGEFEKAIGVANRGLQQFPGNKVLVNKMVGILTDLGLYSQAFEVAKRYDPHGTAYNNLLHQVAAQARMQDSYDIHGRLYAETHDREALTYLINTSLTRGYYDDARMYLSEGMKLEGRSARLLMKQYALEKRMGNEHEMHKLLLELYAMNPNDEELQEEYTNMMLQLAINEMSGEQWADAAQHLKRVLEIMPVTNESWPSAVSRRITCLGHMGQYDEARKQYREAADKSAANRKRFASAYEDIVANRLHFLIEEENYDEALQEAQQLLEVMPESEAALRCCINMSQTLKKDDLFQKYARMGYEAFPNEPYFIVKQAISLQQQGQSAEALALLKKPIEKDHTMLDAAFSGISAEWAQQLIKNHMPDIALTVIDSALVHDAKNKELLYMKGLAYEQMKVFDKAYEYQRNYYVPNNAEQKEYYQHLHNLYFRGRKNRVDASYTYASYDSRQNEAAISSHLYSIATVAYSRIDSINTYTAQISYKGIDGSHNTDEDNTDEDDAGGVGLEFMAQWERDFNHRWSGTVNFAYSTRFFNKIGANIMAAYHMNRDWTPSLRLGYRRTPKTYLFMKGGNVTHDNHNLFIVTPAIEKSWERMKASCNIDVTFMESSVYYNIGLKGKLFINEDYISSVSLLTGFGSFPELTFFEQTALNNMSHTNAMVGFDAQYLVTKNMCVGLTGSWNTYFNPYRDASRVYHDSYRNVYSITAQLHVVF